MRGRLPGIVGLMCVAFVVGCHDPDRVRRVEAYAVLSTTEFDFGEVPVGEWRAGEIRIRNVGHVPFTPLEVLRLDDNQSFQGELVDPGMKIMPGEERTVRLYFHPLKEGELQSAINVRVDAEHGTSTPVTVKGKGAPTPIIVEPATLDFQTLETDSDRELTFRVKNPVDLPLTLSLGGEFKDPFSADVVTIPPFGEQEIKTRYKPMVVGEDRAQVEIRACDGCTPTAVGLSGKAVGSAFLFDPAPVPFDEIPVHQTTLSRTKLTNVTWRPVDISALSTSDRSFVPLTPLQNQQIQPGQSVEVEVQYAARYSGPAVGTLNFDYQSNKPRIAQVVLDARGGRPQLAVAPVAVDFGEVLVGAKLERTIRMTNAGTSGNLHFVGIRAEGPQTNQFDVSAPFRDRTQYPWEAGSAYPDLRQVAPGVAIAPGADYLDLKVYFAPTLPGAAQLQLVFRSDDMFSPERVVTITGTGVQAGACEFEVRPIPEIDFGNVHVGRGAIQGFRFVNKGIEPCGVRDIKLSNNGNGAFWMPGGEIAGGVIPRGGYFSAMIAFKAASPGHYEGELTMGVSSPTQPQVRLPIKAAALPTCITTAPHYIDFGAVRFDCAAPPRTTFVSNSCSVPVTVEDIRLGNGTSEQFTVSGVPAMPRQLLPGEGFELTINYAREVLGLHFTPLYIQASGEPVPYLLPLFGETNHEGLMRERFVQGTDSELDVLFVVANTTTMGSYQQRLKDAIPEFLETARERGVSVRAGVTSTGLVERSSVCGGGALGGEAGRLFPADNSRGRIAYSTNSNAQSLLQSNVEVGLCHNLNQGLETMRAALSSPLIDNQDDPRTPLFNDGNKGLLRDTARTAVVLLADEDDHSGFDPQSYVQFLQTFKGPGTSHRTKAHAIVPVDPSCKTAGPPGPRFAAVAQGTGGRVVDVCSSSYRSLLEELVSAAQGSQRDFHLTEVPINESEISVRVNGVAQTDGQWRFDPAQNAIVFEDGFVPATGQNVDVRYRSQCRVNP